VALALFLGVFSSAVIAAQGDPVKIQPDLKNLTAEQKTAVDMADKFLKEKKTNWGKPITISHEDPNSNTFVGKGKHIYVLQYPTPEDEIKLISFRTVIVNVETKKVKFTPRK
jgi:hypothetical protein